MTAEEAINLAREALDRAHARMKGVWIDKLISDEELQRAHDDAHLAAGVIADLQLLLKRKQ